jgi:hypothetical protein
VDETIVVYVQKLTAEQRAATTNQREYDCIKLVTRAVEWEE